MTASTGANKRERRRIRTDRRSNVASLPGANSGKSLRGTSTSLNLLQGLMAETAVSAVLRNVGNLAVQETSFLGGVTLEVAFLKDELMPLQGYLRDAESRQRSGNASVAILMSQIMDAAYEAENVIEAAA